MATKVSSAAIKKIRQQGMAKTIRQYKAGEGDAEFRTAVERFYSPKHLKGAGQAVANEVKESGMGHKYDLVMKRQNEAQQEAAKAELGGAKATVKAVGAAKQGAKPKPKPVVKARPKPAKAAVSRRISKPVTKQAAKPAAATPGPNLEASRAQANRQEKEEARRGAAIGPATSAPATAPISSSRPANATGSSVLGRRNAEYVSRNITQPAGRYRSTTSAVTSARLAGPKKAASKGWKKNVARPFSRAFNL